MSLLIKTKGGIEKLSELTIDADKDWQQREISNLKAVAEGMVQGDIAYRGADVLQRLPADYGVGYNFLHVKNSGQLEPEWMDIQDLVAYLTGAVNRMVALPTLMIPRVSLNLAADEDHSGGGFTAAPLLSVTTPTAVMVTAMAAPAAVSAAIAHDDDPPTDTDETAETNSPTTNDMHLLPSPSAVGDGFYFGLADSFDWVCLDIGTAGAGSWSITWKYWNGSTWTALSLKYDETGNFRTTGKKWAHWNRPGDWAITTILTHTLYFVKAEVTSYGSMTNQPLGSRAWIGKY